ncbi:MAG: hypothetical protein HY847_10365 [Betaproteobacteria bacterium]|nr:hypothetical protein [Betaproteobacteria bacterium]
MIAAMGSPARNGETRTSGKLVGPQIKAPTSEFCFPTIPSVKAAVLADLLSGRKITHLDCWREHGSSRLSHHILRLRKAGFPVITQEIDAKTSDGRVAQIGLYSLPTEAIEAAGERGLMFITEVQTARGMI